MPNTVPLTEWGTDEKNTVTPGVTGAYRVFVLACVTGFFHVKRQQKDDTAKF